MPPAGASAKRGGRPPRDEHSGIPALAQVDGPRAKVVELRFFGGSNGDWKLASAWLNRELRKG
jgi:hypothetical protein